MLSKLGARLRSRFARSESRVRGACAEQLENRTLLSLTSSGVETTNMGKGDWIWQVPSAEKNTNTTDVQGLVDYLKAKGLQWVIIKAGDGNDGPIFNYGDGTTPPTNGSWTQWNADTIKKFHDAGIKVFGYHFVYGGGSVGSKAATTTPEGEKQVAEDIMAVGGDGLVIDAEGAWETLPNKDTIAADYCQSFRDKYPYSFLAYAPFVYPSLHSGFPYATFGKFSDVVMPQAYWKTISRAQTPEKMVTDMDTEFRALYSRFAQLGQASSIKPIVPIAQGYDPSSTKITPGSEVATFIELLKSDQNPASPGGYRGVSFWSVQHHTDSIWQAVGAGTIGTTGGRVTGMVFNDTN